MEKSAFDKIRSWFRDYAGSYTSNNPDIEYGLHLKQIHSFRVAVEARNIALYSGFSIEDTTLAQCIGLLHDIGRFEQYTQYSTFLDAKSVNHAELGATILQKQDILPSDEKELILKTITYHNRFEVPADESPRVIRFSKLLRDADKLDIWRIVTHHYETKNFTKENAIDLGLPNDESYNPAVLESTLKGKIASYDDLHNVNDFKLLQLGWVFDITYPWVFSRILKRKFTEKIVATLPQKPEFQMLNKKIHQHLTTNSVGIVD